MHSPTKGGRLRTDGSSSKAENHPRDPDGTPDGSSGGQPDASSGPLVEAVDRDPSDGVSAVVLDFVRNVASGRRRRPETLLEVFPYE